ncbi:MAG: DUF4433 domain-containing protein [bacterium]
MMRTDLKELHYITAIGNVPSILQHGILSHKRADKVIHKSVAMQEIQDRRKSVVVPNGRPLHEYANLYFNARNPMLFKDVWGGIFSDEDLCVLIVTPDVIDLPDVVITDRNASSNYTRFRPSPSGLLLIDEDTFAESWKHPESEVAEWEHKSKMCAEVLVPNVVPNRYIMGAYVSCAAAKRKLRAVAPSLTVTINKKMFFKK